MYDFKFDTFAWYADKNHPIYMVIQFYDDSSDGGHVVVGGGYNRANESIQIINPGEYEHKEYMPYSELTDIAVFETKNGHQIAVNIDSIVVYP